MTGDLVALAERVERATGADRELDALIEKMLPCSPAFARHHPGKIMSQWNERAFAFYCPGDEGRDYISPAYTASLDAALSLVPERHTVQLSDWDHPTLRERGPWQAIVLPFGARGTMQQFTFTNRCDHAATPALALVCACLRARAQESGR